jgi:hypothetical protein
MIEFIKIEKQEDSLSPGSRIKNSIPKLTPTAKLYGTGWLQIKIRRGKQLILCNRSVAANVEYKPLTCAAEGVFFSSLPRTASLSGFPAHHGHLIWNTGLNNGTLATYHRTLSSFSYFCPLTSENHTKKLCQELSNQVSFR